MISLTDILDDARIPNVGAGHRHGRAGWVQIDCPWCGRDSGRFHLGISLVTGSASCWRCGRKSAAEAIAQITGKKPGEIWHRLKDLRFQPMPARTNGRFRAPVGVCGLGVAHKAYLAKRGYNPALCESLWGAQGIGQQPRLRWRIYIPIINHGKPVSWTTRAINPKEKQRYISAPAADEGIPHKRILYGSDYARHTIIIHEGPLDVWATGPGAVAVCGTAYTEAQVLEMSRYNTRVVCFDSEPNGQARAATLARVLGSFPGSTYNVTLETGKDSSDADPGEIAELRKAYLE